MVNLLAAEKSPYLLQHKDNPVDWFPWGTEAFTRARSEDKPVFLSIGYSTCYWCHMMETDSFERDEVAEVLNKYYIAIKVDREERPDIDQVYMDAVVAMTGQGGWPMSVFLTPDKKPFWGGTFFWRDQFIDILQQLQAHWQSNREQIIASSSEISEFLLRPMQAGTAAGTIATVSAQALEIHTANFDPRYGGFGKAPKFPPAMTLSFLLRLAARQKSDAALTMVTTTLTRMAHGGLYDQLGGGFSRYATDEKWLVPHFEKMLYDNALLARVYAEAYAFTGDETYQAVLRDILNYISRDMTDSEGGFHSAEDAGPAGKEGEFYTWSGDQLHSVLSDSEYLLAAEYLKITEQGNFEGTNILTFNAEKNWTDRTLPEVHAVFQKLYTARLEHPRPHRDDKILTGWNALMISAFLEAYRVLGAVEFREIAERQLNFLLATLYRDSQLKRRYRAGDARFAATLEDYTLLIDSLLLMHQSTRDFSWLKHAITLQAEQDSNFWDQDAGGYFASVAPDLYIQKKEFFDNAVPSGNAVALRNLISLAALTGETMYYERYQALVIAYQAPFSRYPTGVSEALREVERLERGVQELFILYTDWSEELDTFYSAVRRTYGDSVLICTGQTGMPMPAELKSIKDKVSAIDTTTFYVCKQGACELPVVEPEAALALLCVP